MCAHLGDGQTSYLQFIGAWGPNGQLPGSALFPHNLMIFKDLLYSTQVPVILCPFAECAGPDGPVALPKGTFYTARA